MASPVTTFSKLEIHKHNLAKYFFLICQFITWNLRIIQKNWNHSSLCISLTAFIGLKIKWREIRIIPENSGQMMAVSREHPPCFIGINYSQNEHTARNAVTSAQVIKIKRAKPTSQRWAGKWNHTVLHTTGVQWVYLTDKNPARTSGELFKPCCFLWTSPGLAAGWGSWRH